MISIYQFNLGSVFKKVHPLLSAWFYGQLQASNSDCNTKPRADNKVESLVVIL